VKLEHFKKKLLKAERKIDVKISMEMLFFT
jgi:hypothetical protein